MLLILSIIVFLTVQPSLAISPAGFENWKKNYIKRASRRGISRSFLKKHLKDVKFIKNVVLKEKNQITSNVKIDYDDWIKGWLRKDNLRIKIAREMLFKYKDLLERVERKYNVDKEIIISIWGVETFFGRITGDYDIISSLVTLSCKGRRKKFFEIQLTAAFRLLYQGHVKRDDLKGSWAGATGQLQFMPSNFNGFAKDFDGDGKKDIWNNHGDIFASIAYYLKKRGWKKNQMVGTFVKKTSTVRRRLKREQRYKLATIPFKNSPKILKGPNYNVIIGWNNSSLFAALNMIIVNSLAK